MVPPNPATWGELAMQDWTLPLWIIAVSVALIATTFVLREVRDWLMQAGIRGLLRALWAGERKRRP